MSDPHTPSEPEGGGRTPWWLWPAVAVVAAFVVARATGGDRGLVCGLFVFAGVMWVSEAIAAPATALIVIAAAPLVGVCTPKEAFAALGNPILFLFVGSFMIAEAMRVHGLGERLARALTSRANTRLTALLATSTAAFLLSMWISNAAATAIVLPIALSVAAADKPFAAAQVLGVAWGASMGGLCTPVGTPPNLIGMRALVDAGHELTFAGFMAIGTPIGALMLLAMIAVLALRFGIRPAQPLSSTSTQATSTSTSTPWTKGEVAAASAFGLAVVGWIVPGLLELAGYSGTKALKSHVAEEVVAVLAAGVLFVWPIHNKGSPVTRALSWQQAARIEWGTVVLFGGGILLGDLANKTGLATTWGQALLSASGAATPFAVVALVTLVALVLSEVASNTASATLVVPLALGLAAASGVSPVVAVVGATLGASFGFMMPISTAPNAMAYATGAVSTRQMASAGIVFDVIGYAIVVAGVLTLAR